MQETAELSGQAPICANCGAALGGEYCAHCGERCLRPGEHALRHIVGEWFEAFSHGEGRLLVSLRTLLLRPGELTREYFRGRRVPYARPVALFFAVNLVYFLLTSLNTFSTTLDNQMGDWPLAQTKQALVPDRALGAQVSATERTEVMADYWALYGARRAEITAGRLSSAADLLAYEKRGSAASRHPAALAEIYRYQERFDERTETLSRALIIALVPMLACFLGLTLAPLHRGLPELLVFVTHLWSGLLLILLLWGWLIAGATHVSQWLLGGRIPALLASDAYGSMALAVLVAIYVYRALRAYFCWPRIGCAILCAWTLAGLFWSLELYRVLLFFVTVYVLH